MKIISGPTYRATDRLTGKFGADCQTWDRLYAIDKMAEMIYCTDPKWTGTMEEFKDEIYKELQEIGRI